MIKRLFDLLGAGLGLTLLWPVGLLIGLGIKIWDGGPAIYGQIRIGQFGRPFRLLKFRTMVVNAERVGVPVTRRADPRITLIGGLLRKTKLDELPQLWNVLVGEMSLVGPRPEVERYVKCYTPCQREVLKYRPGITDRATLWFRNEEALLSGASDVEAFYLRYCLPRKIELNRTYLERASLMQDIGIILQTLWQVAVDCFSGGAERVRRLPLGGRSEGIVPGSRVAIIGATTAALELAGRLDPGSSVARRVVAFFDDDPRAWHKRHRGVPVVGMPECLLKPEWSGRIDEIIVAARGVEPARMEALRQILEPLRIKLSFDLG